jgi:hypothetical protein
MYYEKDSLSFMHCIDECPSEYSLLLIYISY